MSNKKDRELLFALATKAASALADARRAGYSLADARRAGYSLADARRAGYDIADAISAGYSLADARRAGYDIADAISAGYSLADARRAGYSLADARRAGYDIADAISAGYDIDSYLKNIPEWENIPVLDKPYTKLLADITEGKRCHQQSTFGVVNDWDPERNICGTPMCTAGHLVNMAGSIGYELKNKYGWEGAGALIHMKAHPDQPCQNFGSIPQSWAMAYLEEMAEREAGVTEEDKA